MNQNNEEHQDITDSSVSAIPSLSPSLPQKVRDLHNHHLDSTVWDDFQFRNDDIIITTYAKSGTTWMQQIISQLIFDGQEDLNVSVMSPWLDLRVPPKEIKLPAVEAQEHRRFIKTHLPLDALVYSPKAKYIFIGRDGRDVVWSLYNHHFYANDLWYDALNNSPGLIGPPIEKPGDSIVDYYNQWLEKDGYPFWSFWEYMNSWWSYRHLPNVLFIHFQNLKDDLQGEIQKIAQFLDINVKSDNLPMITEHCTFDYMKQHSMNTAPLGGVFWEGGSERFIHKGTNGRWKDMLSDEDSMKYEQMARENLGEECANWLKTGQL